MFDDKYWMREALKEAQLAAEEDEIPVGAVIVCNNSIIAKGHNYTETCCDVTAHAEMQAITAAASTLGAKYLRECTLYVTLEPCPMCAGALYWSQISRVVYGASDSKHGYTTISSQMLHPKTEITKGILAEDCQKLLKDFFQSKRH